jgi:hypothetical protein
MILDAVASRDKSMHVVEGANHYFVGQPDHLDRAARHLIGWLAARGLH